MEENSLFELLTLSLGNAALIGLGLMPDPMTDKSEVNLSNTMSNIDILLMLREKTQGNLCEKEKKMLDDLIHDLQLKLVEVQKKQV